MLGIGFWGREPAEPLRTARSLVAAFCSMPDAQLQVLFRRHLPKELTWVRRGLDSATEEERLGRPDALERLVRQRELAVPCSLSLEEPSVTPLESGHRLRAELVYAAAPGALHARRWSVVADFTAADSPKLQRLSLSERAGAPPEARP